MKFGPPNPPPPPGYIQVLARDEGDSGNCVPAHAVCSQSDVVGDCFSVCLYNIRAASLWRQVCVCVCMFHVILLSTSIVM